MPVASFAAVMGILGIALAWRRAAETFGFSAIPGETLVACGAGVFVAVAARYARAAFRGPELIAAQFRDRASGVYFSTITISLSLLAAGVVPYSIGAASWLWAFGAAGSLVLWLLRLERWFLEPNELADVSPAWLLPAVGNAVAATAGAHLGYGGFAWFSFAAALGGWLALLPVVMHRLILGERVAQRLVPSLFLIASAPAILGSAWLALNGGRADPAFTFFAFQTFFAVPLVVRLAIIIGNAPFSIAWWGFTFPASAIAGVALEYEQTTPSAIAAAGSIAALAGASAVIAYVGTRQLEAWAIARRSMWGERTSIAAPAAGPYRDV